MSDSIIQSLQITVLGMGLVFGAIIVLWLMMVLLTSLTADKKTVSDSPQPAPLTATPSASPDGTGLAEAAAVAVVMALAEQETASAHALPEPPTAIVSAWQLGMRTRLLAAKGSTRRR